MQKNKTMNHARKRRFSRRVAPAMRRLKPVIVVVVLLTCVGGCGMLLRSCFSRETSLVRISYAANMRSLPLFVALERDMFVNAGLTVRCEPFESPSEGLKGLTEDRADLCITIPIVSLVAAETDKPGSVKMMYLAVLSADGGNDAILVRRNSTMAGPAELRGRRIGMPAGKTNRAFARLALRPYLGDNPAVTFVELPAYDLLNALKNRNVMALLAFEPTIAEGEDQGISRVLVRGPLARSMMDPMPIAGAAVAMSFVEGNPKTTRKVLAVLQKAAEYARRNEDEARRIAGKHLRLKDDLSSALPLSTIWMLPELDDEKRDRLQQFADLLHREDIIDEPYRMERLYLEGDAIPRRGTRGSAGSAGRTGSPDAEEQ